MFRNVTLRHIAAALLVTPILAFLAISCFTPRSVTREQLKAGDYPKNEELRLTYDTGSAILKNGWTLEYPFVEGDLDQTDGKPPLTIIERAPGAEPPSDALGRPLKRVRFNIEDARTIEIYTFSRAKVGGLVGGSVGAVAITILVLLAVAGGAAALSCPTVYVTAGATVQIAGGIHPGSVFIERSSPDYLRLPAFSGDAAIEIRNEHNEIEHLDAAALAVVTHRPGERVVMAEGRLIVVRDSGAAEFSISGADPGAVAVADGLAFQSGIPDDELVDRIDIRFSPAARRDLALLVTAENTRWFDFLTEASLARGDGRRPAIGSVALQVSVDGVAREQIAPVGSDGFRTFAIQLGALNESAVVSITAPRGCWRFDEITVARVVDPSPRVAWYHDARLPRSSRAGTLASADGKTLTLRRGDTLRLSFPPADCDKASCFLWTVGTYEVAPSLPDSLLARIPSTAGTTFDELHAALGRERHAVYRSGAVPVYRRGYCLVQK